MTCKELLKAYLDNLKEGFDCLQEGDRLSVVAPFLYPDNDNIEVFIKDKGDRVVVHDFGETIRGLDSIGMDIEASDNLTYQVTKIRKNYEVELDRGVLQKTGPREAVGSMVFDLIAVCQYVSSLGFGGKSYIPLTFSKQVEKLFDSNKITYVTNYHQKAQVSGKDYRIDFKVTADQSASYIQVQEARNEASIGRWVSETYRMWSELRNELKSPHVVSRQMTLLNDTDSVVKDEDVKSLRTVSEVHIWSERDRFLSAVRNGHGKNGSPHHGRVVV
jgi:hypothetical protein